MESSLRDGTKYHTIPAQNTIFIKMILLLLIGVTCGSVDALPLNYLSESLIASIDEPFRYLENTHSDTFKIENTDKRIDDNYLGINTKANTFSESDDISNINLGDNDDSYDSSVSKRYGRSQTQHPYKLVKKALSLFAHWKPSLYASSEDNSMSSDVVSAVARGHSRPIGGPLRWGRRR